MLAAWPDGRVKFFTLAAALRLRRAHPDLFLRGDYEPLAATTIHPHLVAFSGDMPVEKFWLSSPDSWRPCFVASR